MNVLNTHFFILVSLRRFAPSETALQRACCESLWPWQFLCGLCHTIVLSFPSAELLEGYRFCSLCTLADQMEGLFYFIIFHKMNNFPYCSPSEKQDFTIRKKLGYQATFCAIKCLVVYVQMVCIRYFSWYKQRTVVRLLETEAAKSVAGISQKEERRNGKASCCSGFKRL